MRDALERVMSSVDARAGRAWHSRDALAAVARALAAQGKLVLERPGAPLAVAPLGGRGGAGRGARARGGGGGGAACGGQLLQLPEVAPRTANYESIISGKRSRSSRSPGSGSSCSGTGISACERM